jgi:chromosome segregation ATPase
MSTTENLDALIPRRDELKGRIDMHLRYDKSTDAPGDRLRDELGQVVGKITEVLHEPFRLEGERLTQKRSEIAAEHEAAQHQRAALRNDLVHAQAARTATLAYGDDPAEHVASADELSAELEGVERRIGELQHRLQGVDGQLTELTVAEGAQIQSGVSAS